MMTKQQIKKAVGLEQLINVGRSQRKQDPVYLSGAGKPLDKAVGDKTQGRLFEADPCDSGFCFL